MYNRDYINLSYNNELYHFGIKGQKWGVRRFQNPDGTLTEEGKRRLGITKYSNDHDSDIVIKKGTEINRVLSTSRYDEYADPEFGGNTTLAKKYVDDILNNDINRDVRSFSVDGVRNSGRMNGKDLYVDAVSESGYDPNSTLVTTYNLKKDINVASGKKVMDALIEEAGPNKLREIVSNKYTMSLFPLTNAYTNNTNGLFDRVNKKFIDMGYDAIEDINDTATDMPIVLFNSTKNVGKPKKVEHGKAVTEKILSKYYDFSSR